MVYNECFGNTAQMCLRSQALHRLEKYLNLEGFLEMYWKIKSAFESTGNSLKGLEKSLNFTLGFITVDGD